MDYKHFQTGSVGSGTLQGFLDWTVYVLDSECGMYLEQADND